MSRNRIRNTWVNQKPEETVEETVEETAPSLDEELEIDAPEVTEEVVGVISGCRKLNVRSEPDINSAVICIVDEKTQVIIDEQESTEDFYKVYIPANISGFCVKKFVSKK